MVVLITLCSCGGRNKLSTDALYRRIQEHEARIAEAEVAVRRADSCRAVQEPAEQGVCDESRAVCQLTLHSQETNAVRRCLLASDSCRAARERAQALCATPRHDERNATE